jgi:hypothetical protein
MRCARRGSKFVHMQNTTTAPAKRARRTRAEWTAEVGRWRKSGLGSAEYATQRGLKRGTLLWWSRQIDAVSVADGAAGAAAVKPVTFVPLRVREEHAEAKSTGQGTIEVILCNGRRVRIAGAVDGGILARVLDAAEGAR